MGNAAARSADRCARNTGGPGSPRPHRDPAQGLGRHASNRTPSRALRPGGAPPGILSGCRIVLVAATRARAAAPGHRRIARCADGSGPDPSANRGAAAEAPCSGPRLLPSRLVPQGGPNRAPARGGRTRRALRVIVAIVALAAARDLAQAQPPPVDCRDWQACRAQALEARERGEYERFHDLAWRAVQTGPPREPALMLLLARAQSLSGRPDDALVMLRRLVALGVAPVEALTDPDFRRARAMARWPEVEAAILNARAVEGDEARPAAIAADAAAAPVEARTSGAAGVARPAPGRAARGAAPQPTPSAPARLAPPARSAAGEAAAAAASAAPSPAGASSATASAARPAPPLPSPGAPAVEPGDTAREPAPNPAGATTPRDHAAPLFAARDAGTFAPSGGPLTRLEEARRFVAPGIVPGGFAYDAVSGRFLLGSRHDRKIVVLGDESTRLVDLVRADSAGFGAVVAMEIDTRRGDLWVASAAVDEDNDAGGGRGRAALHKLQLVSGRPLLAVPLRADAGPARLTALAVTPGGTVLALDPEGRRLWRVAPGARVVEVAARLDVDELSGLAAASDRRAYVAHAGGLLCVDLPAATPAPVAAPPDVSLAGLESLRWHAGAIIAVQRSLAGAGDRRIVRLHLDRRGTRVVGLDVVAVVDPQLGAPLATAIAADTLYYLAGGAPEAGRAGAGGAIGDAIVWRVALR
jgi:hypothetical protein